MSKLLSDEELDRQLKSILEAELSVAEVAAYVAGNKGAITDIMRHQLVNLINTQKRLYAVEQLSEVVDDKPLTTMYVPLNLYVERIETRIAEQRASIK